MLQTLIGVILTLFIPPATGYAVLRCLNIPRKPFVLSVPAAFGIGFGVIGNWALILLVLHQPLNTYTINVPLCLFILLLAGTNVPDLRYASDVPQSSPLDFFKRILLLAAVGYILYQIIFIITLISIEPVYSWDGIQAIAIKSKFFYYGGDLHCLKNFFESGSYPLLVELLQTWVACNIQTWDDQRIKIIFAVIILCYLAFHYGFLRIYTGTWRAAIGTALILTSNFFIFHGTLEYRAIFFLFYNALAIALILFWHRFRRDELLILGGLMAGFGGFVKLEAIGHFGVYAILLAMTCRNLRSTRRQTLKTIAYYFIPAFALYIIFPLTKLIFHLQTMQGRLGLASSTDWGERLQAIAAGYMNNLFFSGNWNIVWFLLLMSFAVNWKKIKISFETRFVLTGLALFLGLYAVIGLLTSSYVFLFGPFSYINLSRTILQFFPLAVWSIMFLVHSKDTV